MVQQLINLLPGDVVALRNDGSSQSLSVNGSVLAGHARDTYFSGNVRTGICTAGMAESDSCTLDNFLVDESKGLIL